MTSLEEKKGTMNSEYFGFMSRDEIQQGNSVARDLPPTGSEANTTIVVFSIYIGYRFPLSLSTIDFQNKNIFSFLFPELFFLEMLEIV